MLIRAYSPDGADATAQLFRETISEVCKDDYTPGQLRAWTSGCDDLEAWNASLHANDALVAEEFRVWSSKSSRFPAILEMTEMDADVADTEDYGGSNCDRRLLPDAQKDERRHRERRQGHRDEAQGPVHVPYFPITSKVARPGSLVEQHQGKRRREPQEPGHGRSPPGRRKLGPKL
ncbi:hypothetical protein [uncultured Adlercreutzia sp.]|uniref:hypothetical protein n=1 Tax=uncultured Adlercreutzia sp. TaxID=875803 RepID=UPI0025FA4FCC|nr:hypothetical protein [uncultured Adlercreutzia sp.]MCI9262143.1 hypothetical protein [Eggerthellaceae bacterium]